VSATIGRDHVVDLVVGKAPALAGTFLAEHRVGVTMAWVPQRLDSESFHCPGLHMVSAKTHHSRPLTTSRMGHVERVVRACEPNSHPPRVTRRELCINKS
jgi:hypothetical protein